jgi:hypothetical protein
MNRNKIPEHVKKDVKRLQYMAGRLNGYINFCNIYPLDTDRVLSELIEIRLQADKVYKGIIESLL